MYSIVSLGLKQYFEHSLSDFLTLQKKLLRIPRSSKERDPCSGRKKEIGRNADPKDLGDLKIVFYVVFSMEVAVALTKRVDILLLDSKRQRARNADNRAGEGTHGERRGNAFWGTPRSGLNETRAQN